MKHTTHLHLEQVKFKNALSYFYVLPISLGVGVANSVQWLRYGPYSWGFDFWQGQKLLSFPGCLLLYSWYHSLFCHRWRARASSWPFTCM